MGIVVYCRSGRRSGQAIDLLLDNGFEGTIHGGMGVSQWTNAGYELVTTDSVPLTGCVTDTSVTGKDCSNNLKPTKKPKKKKRKKAKKKKRKKKKRKKKKKEEYEEYKG